MKIDLRELELKEISEIELDNYLSLISDVKNNMEHPEWLGDFSKEDYINLIKNNAHIYACIYNDELIAAGVLIPSSEKDLNKFLSQDLNHMEVVDFGPEVVHPNYVGNGLQDRIIKFLEKKSIEFGYKYGLVTIHPDNIYSIKNLINNGFLEIGYVELKRGPRKIYRKNLKDLNNL